MTDFRLMRGDGWVRCCICGELHTDPFPDLYRDHDGQMWDSCAGCSDNVLVIHEPGCDLDADCSCERLYVPPPS